MSAKKPRKKRLLNKLLKRVGSIPKWVIFRIVFTTILFLPWLLWVLGISIIKMRKWRRVDTSRDFLMRHELAFRHLDLSHLEIETISGGVSNTNQIWHCRSKEGEPVQYFVKVFVSIGTFWAKNLSLVSPFPQVYGSNTHDRFTVDMVSRVQLTELGISVPRLVTFDTVEKVMVTEMLQGENVDAVLKRIEEKGGWDGTAREVIRQCGIGLGRIHDKGYSLIDTQPVNCLWVPSEDRVYFTDLEYCTRQDRQIWDVSFFMCFIVIRLPKHLKHDAKTLFLNAYAQECRTDLKKISEKAREMRDYLPIFESILDIREFTPEELFEELSSFDFSETT